MKLRVALGLLVIVSGGFAGAEEPMPWRVRVDVEMVSLPMKEGVRLLPQLRRAETYDQALARIQKLVATGEAELLGWPTVESQSGGKGRTESLYEVRYGEAYEQPQIPGAAIPRPLTVADTIPRPFDVPTAFTGRNTGPALECKAFVEPATGKIELALLAQHLRLVAMEPAIGARAQRPAGDQILQPRISDFRTQTSLTVQNGARVLLDTFNLEAPTPRLVFFLLHVSAKAPSHP